MDESKSGLAAAVGDAGFLALLLSVGAFPFLEHLQQFPGSGLHGRLGCRSVMVVTH